MYAFYESRGSLFEPFHMVHTDGDSKKELYLGNYLAACDEKFLSDKNIKYVLTVASGLGIKIEDKGIEHKVIQAQDLPSFNLGTFFDETFEWIDKRITKGNVFVHCAAGVSRSGATVIAYLIRKYGWDFFHALKYVQEKRKMVSPNEGFCKQLKEYQIKYQK